MTRRQNHRCSCVREVLAVGRGLEPPGLMSPGAPKPPTSLAELARFTGEGRSWREVTSHVPGHPARFTLHQSWCHRPHLQECDSHTVFSLQGKCTLSSLFSACSLQASRLRPHGLLALATPGLCTRCPCCPYATSHLRPLKPHSGFRIRADAPRVLEAFPHQRPR